MLSADPFSSLEGVEGVWEVDVRIRFVDQLVQTIDALHHSHLSVSATRPLGMLGSEVNDYYIASTSNCRCTVLQRHAYYMTRPRHRKSHHLAHDTSLIRLQVGVWVRRRNFQQYFWLLTCISSRGVSCTEVGVSCCKMGVSCDL